MKKLLILTRSWSYSNFLKNGEYFVLNLSWIESGIHTTSRNSLLEYWASSQYCLSLSTNLFLNRDFVCLVTIALDSVWTNFSLNLRISSRSSLPEVSIKKVFLKILQNLHENTCARVSFFNKVAGLRPEILLKKKLWHRCLLGLPVCSKIQSL